MLNNILKVYGEDLINGSLAASSVSSSKVIAAGETQGALVVNVFANGTVETKTSVTITIKDSAEENGTFATLQTITIAADKTFADGDLIDSVILPVQTKAFISATASSSSTNSGSIRVTLGYLAR